MNEWQSTWLLCSQVLIVPDCSPAGWSATVNKHNCYPQLLREQGVQLTWPVQQLLFSCCFQPSACSCVQGEGLSAAVFSPKKKFPRTGKCCHKISWHPGKEEWFSVVQIWFPPLFQSKHSTWKGKPSEFWQQCWFCLGDFSSNISMTPQKDA